VGFSGLSDEASPGTAGVHARKSKAISAPAGEN
jgi:hypothetical protein